MLAKTHPFFPKFVELMKRVSEHEPIYDLGTSGRFAKEMSFVRHLFEQKQYKAGGYQPDLTVAEPCDLHCDVQDLQGLATNSVGSIISLEVLEHVQDPKKTLEEAFRVLRPGGVCLLSTPFLTSYHGKTAFQANGPLEISNDHASYADYWRFTHEGLFFLFKAAGFSSIEIYPINGPISARLELLKLQNILQHVPFLWRWIYEREKPRLGKMTTRHFVLARKEL